MAAQKPLVLVAGVIRQLSASDTLSAAQTRSALAPVVVTVTASPFTYTPTADGLLIVAGGTVTKQEYKRGAAYVEVGLLNSMLLVLAGDALRVTYSVAPKITFIPR